MEKIEIKNLMTVRSMRAVFKSLAVEQIEKIESNLAVIKKEHLDAEAENMKLQSEKAEKVARIRELMAEDNILASDLEDGSNPVNIKLATKPRKQPEPKYQYKNEQGEVKTWTGQGRTPKAIQKAIDNGKSFDDFLIA
ncbi:H-NS family nucleoid-associated regulatory protein [Vibrio splendidus]|nr:H-NS family nucleoid-associated regulatory protein [Vibrio splendidus]MCC4881473.1 H-NS histone family protein [Vibrio splendidus]